MQQASSGNLRVESQQDCVILHSCLHLCWIEDLNQDLLDLPRLFYTLHTLFTTTLNPRAVSVELRGGGFEGVGDVGCTILGGDQLSKLS